MRRNHHNVFFIIVPVLLLAAFLRIYHLDTIPNGFLPGEAMRGYDAYSLGHTGADSFGVRFPLFLRGFDDYVAALYSYVAAPLVYFGLSVFSLRLTSALLGILTVAVAFQISRRPFGNTAAIAGSVKG